MMEVRFVKTKGNPTSYLGFCLENCHEKFSYGSRMVILDESCMVMLYFFCFVLRLDLYETSSVCHKIPENSGTL